MPIAHSAPIRTSTIPGPNARVRSGFNTPYFGNPNGIGFSNVNQITPDTVRMAEIRGLRNPMRVIQFGLKLFF